MSLRKMVDTDGRPIGLDAPALALELLRERKRNPALIDSPAPGRQPTPRRRLDREEGNDWRVGVFFALLWVAAIVVPLLVKGCS